MRFHVLTCSLLLCVFTSFSQVNADFVPSSGTIPKIMADVMIPFYILPTYSRDQYLVNTSKHGKTLCKSTLLNSGFVTFGTRDAELINEEFKKISAQLYPGETFDVLIFRSTFAGTFHYDNTIFITTKLLSFLNSKEDILFYLTREVEAIKAKNVQLPLKKILVEGLVDFVEFACFKGESHEMELDKLAFLKLQTTGFTQAKLVRALSNAMNAQMPFGDDLMDPSYISSDQLVLPSNLFDLSITSPQEKLLSIINYENGYKNRLKPYNSENRIELATEQSQEFKDLFLRSKIELVRLEILNSEYLSAIYKIMNLEQDYNLNLDYLKGVAWVGIVDQEFGGNKKRKSLPFYGSAHKSAGFFSYINVQNAYLKCILSLNEVTKLMASNPKNEDFKTMRKHIIAVLNSSPYFDVKKYDEIPQASGSSQGNAQINLKDLNFYLGKLNRLVTEGELLKMEQKQAPQFIAEKEKGNEKTLIKSVNKQKFDEKRSRKLEKSTQSPQFDYSSIAYYNEFEHYAMLMFQAYENSRYEKTFLPGNFNYYARNDSNTTYHDFFGDYRPKARPVHFIALTGVGLVYVIPNLFISSQTTWNTMVTLEKGTGEMLAIRHEFSKDYLNKMNIKARQINY